jgi:BON domain
MLRKRKSILLLMLALVSLWGCSKAPADATLADSLKARFFSDPLLKAEPIGIEVRNGEVTLSGEVSNDGVKGQAGDLARAVPGVTKVNDQLLVKPAMAAQLPPVPEPGQQLQGSGPTGVVEPPPPPKKQPAPAAPPPPQPRRVTIPEGTDVRIQMIDSVNSDKNQIGSTFQASLQSPIVVGSEVVVPKGADVSVKLVDAKSSGKFKGSSGLLLALDSLQFQGSRYPLSSTTYEQVGQSRGKQTAKRVGLGAGIGTAIGAIAGGGKGAAIGAGIGAGAGVATQVFTKGKKVQVPSETVLDFKLEAPVQLTLKPKQHKKTQGEE